MPSLIVLSEATDQLAPSASRQDLKAATAIARLLGFPVYTLPPDLRRATTVANAIAHIPPPATETPALWLGFIPTPERYTAFYQALLQNGIRLLNTPTQHRTALEFDRAYPLLAGLTPESVIVQDVEACEAAIAQLGLPVFVRGAVQSYKEKGWQSCVAHSLAEAQHLTQQLLHLPQWSRGRVLLRRLEKLKRDRTAPDGFPLGREFRILLYGQSILSYGYQWEGDDPYRYLSVPEEEGMFAIALEAARRLQVPYLAVDVAQLEAGDWTVIETCDAQFVGLTQMPLIQFWYEVGRQVGEGGR